MCATRSFHPFTLHINDNFGFDTVFFHNNYLPQHTTYHCISLVTKVTYDIVSVVCFFHYKKKSVFCFSFHLFIYLCCCYSISLFSSLTFFVLFWILFSWKEKRKKTTHEWDINRSCTQRIIWYLHVYHLSIISAFYYQNNRICNS